MITDRHRVELLLPAHIMYGVFLNGVDDKESAVALELRTFLELASVEPVQDLREPERSKILRRAKRVYDEITQEYNKPDALVAKLGLIGYYLLRALTDEDYLVIYDGSVMGKSMDRLLPLLDEWAAQDSLDRSAQKQARKVLQHLQRLGYYRGVRPEKTD